MHFVHVLMDPIGLGTDQLWFDFVVEDFEKENPAGCSTQSKNGADKLHSMHRFSTGKKYLPRVLWMQWFKQCSLLSNWKDYHHDT